jgi:serine/threonine protein kinase
MQSPRWTAIQESEFPWEREALTYLRDRLPDAEPFRAYANFEFIAEDGSINEVDLLVVSLYRIYLVEIKSRPGRVEGDAASWTWTTDGVVRTVDNPLLLANRKAKKLKDLLRRQKAMQRHRVPYVESIVFLSHQNTQCRLTGAARTGVYLRPESERDGNADIVSVLSGEVDQAGGAGMPGSRIDAPLSRAIGRALADAGIRPTQRHRQVGDYVLGRLLVETDVYQDWEATHVRFGTSHRRIRIYPNALQSSETSRTERHRAAEREYRLLDGVIHPGILRVEQFTEHERGPALVFEHPEGADRLDFFLHQHAARLDLAQRLELVRQLAETLKYAHSRRLYHQALTPQSILVTAPSSGAPGTKIYNWQAGRREMTSEAGTRLSVNHIVKVGLAGEAEGAVYLAPELYSVGALDPAKLDVFSLGALTYHLVSGTPPAGSIEELHEKLLRSDGLWLSEAFDGANEEMELLVVEATAPDVSDRLDVAEFVTRLDQVIAELAKPEQGRYEHPLDAGAGDVLEGGFVVQKRLGKGSTSVALLVERDGQEGVLKVALEPKLNDRLRQEAAVLRRREVRHQNIVELYEELELSGHVVLYMATAGVENASGTYTLAQRIREEGRLSLDLLQRFGDELLGVVDWLEQNGISHRDIKPDNIGIGQTPSKKLTLVLFDFSLSGMAAENIRAGTPPYLDPFLQLRKPPRWDLYAERFAAAVTLYEMATGDLPGWGDGQSNPALLDCEVTLATERFDPAVRDDLTRFFLKALARDHRKRFDNAEEMRRAWARVFEHIDQPITLTDPGEVDPDAALAEATEETPVASLGLTPRVLNALERIGVHTLGELRDLPRIRLYRNKGIGQRTVRDIRELAERVAEVFAGRGAKPAGRPEGVAMEEDPAIEPQFWSVDLISRRLVSRQLDEDDASVLRHMLGLDGTREGATRWPAQQDVAEAVGIARTDVQQIVERARERWAKQAWMTALRADVEQLLEKHGGVVTQGELSRALLAARGSAASDTERVRNASAAAYAAIETEATRESARFILYRGREHVFVVATQYLGEHLPASPAARAKYAEALGAKADELADADPLLVPDRIVEELTAVPAPEGERPLTADRMLRLAVNASARAALSSRMEIYPRGMPAARALRLGAGSLLGPKRLPPEQVQQRIASRYPEAEPLPGRPQLDALLEDAGVHYRWDAEANAYTPPLPHATYLETSSTWSRHGTGGSQAADAPDVGDAWTIERKLQAAAKDRRFLVLTAAPNDLRRAEREILDRFPVQRVDLDRLILRELKSAAGQLGARWEVVLNADAASRDSADWRRLQQLVDRAMPAVRRALEERTEPALLVNPGLLARYGQLALLEALRQACERGDGPGYVVLVPADARSTMPVVDGVPLPVVLASEWARIPGSWVANAHRAAPAGSG